MAVIFKGSDVAVRADSETGVIDADAIITEVAQLFLADADSVLSDAASLIKTSGRALSRATMIAARPTVSRAQAVCDWYSNMVLKGQ